MRSALYLAAAALVLSGCNCSKDAGTSYAGPVPNILQPTETDADGHVLDFGTVRADQAIPPGHIIIENDGRSDWNISKITLRDGATATLSLDPGAQFAASNDGGPAAVVKVPTGGQIDLKVTWAPMFAEQAQGFVDIDSDYDKQPRITVKIIGTAVAPGIQVCLKDPPASGPGCDTDVVAPDLLTVDFGTSNIADPAVQKSLLVKNLAATAATVDVSLHLSSVAFQDGTSTEFSIELPSVLTVPPGGQIELPLSYKPIDGGYDDAWLQIASDDPKKPMVKVHLTGGGKAPKLCVDPAMVDFGGVAQGTYTDQQVKISSCGVNPLSLTAAALGAGSSAEFTLPQPLQLPMTLAPGASVNLRVRFAPTDLNPAGGNIAFSSDGGDLTVLLKGQGVTAPACALQLTPLSVDYGQVATNGFSDKVIFGTNLGQKECNLFDLAGPTGSSAFALMAAPPLPYVVNPGAQFTLTVRFTPPDGTQQTATLVATSDDPNHGTLTINLKGSGRAPKVGCDPQLSPGSLNFGTVPSGTGKAMTVTLNNFGAPDPSGNISGCWLMDASLAAGSTGFAVTGSPMMPGQVDAGAHTDFQVTFTPQTGGDFTGTLDVTAGSYPIGGTVLTVPLTGTAGAPAICITPATLDFGTQAAGTTAQQGFTIQSCGPGALELRGINLEAGSSTDYTILKKPAVPTVLTPGQTATVTVQFAASSNGPAFGRVKVLSNDKSNPTSPVLLKANAGGCFTSVLNCAPVALHYPKTATGLTASLTFSCVSLGTTGVGSIAVALRTGSSAAFALSGRAVPATLPPGQSFRMAVDYSPTAVASDTGFVDITSDDCQRPLQTVTLDGLSKIPDFPPCIPPKTFLPTIKWKWNPTVAAASNSVWITPLVVPTRDTNGDGRVDEEDTPTVLFSSTEGIKMNIDPTKTDTTPPAILRAVDGHTGAELWEVTDPGLALNSEAQIAAADIDGDNLVEIIGSIRFESPGTGTGNMEGKYKTGRMIAFENDGSFKWVSDWWNRSSDDIEDGSAINIADLDGDGVPEIIIGASVFDADGTLLWEGKAGQGSEGHGVFSVVADINGDGQQEVIAGNTCYSSTGQVLWTYGDASWDGLSIVVDVDGDGAPEIVLRTDPGTIIILDANGQKKYGPWDLNKLLPNPLPDSICSAPITAADFDGDGAAELAIPAGNVFVMMKPVTGQIVWTQPIEDYQDQCGAAGAAAFDFEGDGKYEAVYADTSNVFVFRGTDGTIVYQDTRSSATIWDTPVIADVSGSGHADILTVQDGGDGVKLLNNDTNDWVAAPRIWNEHAYHYTNVYQNGTVPRVEKPSWKVFNAYRANMPQCLK